MDRQTKSLCPSVRPFAPKNHFHKSNTTKTHNLIF